MPDRRYAIVDVETTGGTTHNSRITDISIFITDGRQVLDEFSTLVNPEVPIPSFITHLTGIDDEMVSGAPVFKEVAEQILEFTSDAIFVAHNVNFDFAMLTNEYRRLQYTFEREKLCTVRLARKYILAHRSYGLGNICADLGIPINGRHRARGDAEATVELFHQIFLKSEGHPTMMDEKWLKGMPAGLDRLVIDRLPETAGLYFLYDDQGNALYIGACGNIFKKVTRLLTSKAKRAIELKSSLADVDFEETGSELIAKLKLPAMLDKHQPAFNNRAKKTSKWEVTSYTDLFGYVHLDLIPMASEKGLGFFNTRKEGEVYLSKLVNKYQLCGHLSSISSNTNCQSQNCMGACRQLEPVESYNARVSQALEQKTFSRSDFVILEQRVQNQQPFVMIEGHEYIGYGQIGEYDEGIADPRDLKNHLNTDSNSFEKMAIIQAYLMKHNPKIINI